MPRKPRRGDVRAQRDLERHHAALAYRLGHMAVMFRIEAEFVWQFASVGDPLPAHLRERATRLSLAIEELHAAFSPVQQMRRKKKAIQAVEQAWKSMETSWLGPRHRALIERRDQSEPEYFSLRKMLRGSPFGRQAWQELRSAMESFGRVLPGEIALWLKLGMSIADIFDGPADELPDGALARLQVLLSAMAGSPLLRSLPIDIGRLPESAPEPNTYEAIPAAQVRRCVAQLHDQLSKRFLDPSTIPAASVVAEANLAPGLTEQEARRGLAVAYALKCPGATVDEIAQAVGVHRTTLYPMAMVQDVYGVRKNDTSSRFSP
jgi:hypothetical protein